MRQNPPAPGPGQVVWIPPVRILERDHGQLISGLPPLGPNGVPATPASRPSGPVVVPVSPPQTAAPAGQYTKVRGGGETLYEIARRTLNDNGQWYLIYRLNPALSADPKLPIPTGTVLRLPPGASVADGDRP
jgi:nucleoid-associated protein YgaU